jgi:hypothetical protein
MKVGLSNQSRNNDRLGFSEERSSGIYSNFQGNQENNQMHQQQFS